MMKKISKVSIPIGLGLLFILLVAAAPMATRYYFGGIVVVGTSDQTQLRVTGYTTQTSDLMVIEQSDGTDVLTVTNAGNLSYAGTSAFNGNTTVGGTLLVDGQADANQLTVQGYTTQTTNLLTLEQSDGTDVFTVTNSGALNMSGALDVDGAITIPVNVEHFGAMSVISQAITYTAATGGSGVVATITDGEIWLVHNVFIQTLTNFDCTGDDCTLDIGDGNDADGFIAAIDASIQAAFTEATGYAAGFYGVENGSGGAYTLDDGGPFVYAPSGGDETIDWLASETTGDTMAAGEAVIYVIYTRIK